LSDILTDNEGALLEAKKFFLEIINPKHIGLRKPILKIPLNL